jgi:hypothetical protein
VYLRGVPAVLVVLNDEEGAVARGRVPLLNPKTLSLVTALPSTRLGGWQPAELEESRQGKYGMGVDY